MDAPFSNLTPDFILDALTSIGLEPDGRLLALNSYENRVYQVNMETGPPLILKCYRPGRWTVPAIQEEHEYAATLAKNDLPIAAPLLYKERSLHVFHGIHFALFPRFAGRAPELGDAETLEWIGRFIGRIHAIGARSGFRHRHTLDTATFGEHPRNWLLTHHALPEDLRPAWHSTINQALNQVNEIFKRTGTYQTIRLHGDCHLGNILWHPDHGPQFVDFDDCCTGPAIQDLWMLLSGSRDEMACQLGHILSGYETFHTFNPRELHLIEALRTLRLIHYSAWLARRWNDPAFPSAFPWFNTPRYWQDRILELREQIALMDEAPVYPEYP